MINNKNIHPPTGPVHRRVLAACLTLIAFIPLHLAAGPLTDRDESYQWRLCPAGQLIPVRPGYTADTTDPESIEIRADSSRLVEEGVSRFDGDVEIVRGQNSIRAEVATYDVDAGIFNAEGRAHLWDGAMIWAGESATYDLNSEISQLHDGKYWLRNGRGRGYAGHLEHSRRADLTVLEDVDYSTCPLSDETWRVSAARIKLDHESDRGSATHAFLRVRDIPVFYFPYVSFPLSDKRKSGFLAPTMGSTNESGFDMQIPYYWNLAPNYDATITPRILTDRGAMLGTEFRYLSHDLRGKMAVEYLPGDNLHGGTDRSMVSLQHSQFFFNRRGLLRVKLNNVSDDEYFEDFGSSIGVTSQRFLDRRATFFYRGSRTNIYTLIQAYQTVDSSISSSRGPYRRLPQIYVRHRMPTLGRLRAEVNADATYFYRDDSLTAGRLNVAPSFSYEYTSSYLSLKPKLTLRHTQYFMDDPDSIFDDNESRSVPILSIDSSLFLERDVALFGKNHLQTFEPRIFYLFVPNVDQTQLPRFDSGLLDVSFRHIFRDNRFTGGDRVGDANQVTTAITSRLLDTENGREAARISVGQIFYFRDREVVLPNGVENEDSFSELVAEAAAALSADWTLRGTVQWDPNERQIQRSTIRMRYRPNLETVLNFRYHFRRARTDVEQTDISARFPLTNQIAILGRWNFSLQENRTLEAIGGVEYESCCWGARIIARRFLRNSEGAFDNGVFLQVHFRGLGGFGRKSGSLLRRGIPGYVDPFE